MGTSILQTDSRKKRSFSLSASFRRSSAGEQQLEVARSEKEMARSAEEAARVQKAAAWQWYTRGVGEAVLPTKRPPIVGKPLPSQLSPIDDKRVVDGRSKATTNNSNVLQKKLLEPPLAESPRAASRFKAESRFARPTSAGAQPPTAPYSTPSHGPSTPLYDEFELSGLRTQMADFVQRLKFHQQTKENQESPAQKSNPQKISVDGRPLPAAASVSSEYHQHTKTPPPSAVEDISSGSQLTKPPPPVASTIPFPMRPFSALHRLFRKVVPGSIIKRTKNSPIMINSSPAVYEPDVLPEEEEKNTPYHYHHYIHHHHHHYHYSPGPEESATAIIRSRRRHSESSGIRPHIPSLLEAESDEEEEEVERSSIEAYLARRRRHSDSFVGHLTPQKAAFDEEEEMKGEYAKELPPRYNSNKIPTMVSENLVQPSKDESDEGFPEIRSRRRHSAENKREEAALERESEGGRGKSGGGTYKLGGAADGATPAKPLVQRRHSECLQRPEGVHYAQMGKRTPSARYLEDVLERQIIALAIANAAPARRPGPRRDLPPIYPQ